MTTEQQVLALVAAVILVGGLICAVRRFTSRIIHRRKGGGKSG